MPESTGTGIRILLTNDDGPPARESPFILGLYLKLIEAGYDVKVVIPSSQKSWIGKAFHMKDTIPGRFYYPRKPGDIEPETSDVTRPLKQGELGEWILLDGTPATCANIGIHNLYPGEIDLVISGPNLGRNTSSAFVLSSGTIGAAMSSSLSMIRSIALSYGVFTHPNPPEFEDPAHDLSLRIVDKLWNNWGQDPTSPRNGETELYNVNIPLVHELLVPGAVEVVWTSIWRNQYGSLFKRSAKEAIVEISPAGPGATPPSAVTETETPASPETSSASSGLVSAPCLMFHFAPEMRPLVHPPLDSLPFGTDAWAVHHAKASVTPLRTCFGEAEMDSISQSFLVDSGTVVNGLEYGGKTERVLGRPWKL